MAIDITLPQLGDGIDSGDVLEVLVRPGDRIDKNHGIIELETDKATVTVPSSQAGTVVSVKVQEGQTIPVGAVILTLDPVGAAEKAGPAARPAASQSTPAGAATAPAPRPEPPPDGGAKSTAGKQPAAPRAEVPKEKRGRTSAEPPPSSIPRRETEERAPGGKREPSMPSVPATGTRRAALAGSGDDPSAGENNEERVLIPAGPAVRRFAREVGVNLRTVQGSGQRGRITRGDVLEVVRQETAGRSAAAEGLTGQRDAYGPIRTEKLSKIRRTIAEKMHESWQAVPRVTNFDDADVTDLESIRQASKKDYAARGIKLTTLPFVVKACAMALRAHPVVNASIDMEAGQIIFKQYVNIGIAIDTERGLIVPSLRRADELTIADIARALNDLSERTRTNQFTLDDLRGSTFSVSNLGAIGGTYSTPIVNIPETAILLVGRSRLLPVVREEKIVPRLMMPLSLSYDHRLIDGAAAARFLNDVVAYLQAPSRLLLAP